MASVPQRPIDPPSPRDDGNPRICFCRAVHEQTLLAAIRDGCHTLAQLIEHTGAGTGCSTCRGELSELLERHVPRELPRS
ncbi:MAG: (2Fe-2S)-binding protein [Planctomycetes bacterium]|nr:(2Fe-2S)-binding protein [Planctomycetota bacterium]